MPRRWLTTQLYSICPTAWLCEGYSTVGNVIAELRKRKIMSDRSRVWRLEYLAGMTSTSMYIELTNSQIDLAGYTSWLGTYLRTVYNLHT
jgi:hypothetical protein